MGRTLGVGLVVGWDRQGVGGFRYNDPCDQVGEHTGSGAEDAEHPDETDEADIPSIVQGDTRAHAGDDARAPRAHELRRWRGSRGIGAEVAGSIGGSAGWAEAAVGCELFSALRAKHKELRRRLF